MKKRKRIGMGVKVIGLTAAASICSTGVLTEKHVHEVDNPFYEMSRSIRFLGSLKRFESLALLGMLLGGFLWLSYILSVKGEREKEKRKWLAAGIWGGIFYWVRIPYIELMAFIGVVCSEYGLPILLEISGQKRHQKGKEKY